MSTVACGSVIWPPHPLTNPTQNWTRKKEKGHLCYVDLIVHKKSEILQSFHLYYYIYSEWMIQVKG